MSERESSMGAVGVLIGTIAVAVCGCAVSDPSPKVAFRAADAVVVVNRATAKTAQGKEWLDAALRDLTNALARVTGKVSAVYEETDYKLLIANCKAQCGKSQCGKSQCGKSQCGKSQCGKSAPSTHYPLPSPIYVGDTEAARAAGLDGLGLRKGDWCVRTVPGKAFVYGLTGMAASFAVSEFCDRHLDYHFYVMDNGEPVVRRPDLTVAVDDLVVRPVLYDRSIYTAMRNSNVFPTTFSKRRHWQRQIYGDATDEIEPGYRVSRQTGGCHAIHDYLPPEKLFKDHPDWFSMGWNGKRKGVRNSQSQICYTNPEARDYVYNSLVKFIEADRRTRPDDPPGVYDMTQMDTSDFLCLCPECRKVIAKYNRKPGGNKDGGDAGLQLEFINDIARRIRVKYPGVQLRVFAYVSSETPPKDGLIRPEPNVIIEWCDVYSHSDHTLPLETPGHFNMRQAQELLDWSKLTSNFQIWDYLLYGHGNENTLPEVSVDAIAADAKLFSRIGVERVLSETEYREQGFYELNSYLMGVLWSHPDRDADELVRGFCRVYGKGAPEMERAIGLLRKWERTQPAREPLAWHNRFLPWLTRANLEKLLAVMESAYAKEPDVACRARILGPLSVTAKRLMLNLKQDVRAGEAFKEAVGKYRRYAKEWYRTGFFEPRDREKKVKGVDEEIEVMTLVFDDIPEALRNVPRKDLVFADYHVSGYGTSLPDTESSRKYVIHQTRPDDDYRGGYPIQCGTYDSVTKESTSMWLKATDLPPDGKYRWFRVGRVHLGPNTGFWFPWSWRGSVPLRNFYSMADGLAEDPNWYDLWISMSVQGPVFDPNSKAKNRIAVDGAILHRQKGPERRK